MLFTLLRLECFYTLFSKGGGGGDFEYCVLQGCVQYTGFRCSQNKTAECGFLELAICHIERNYR